MTQTTSHEAILQQTLPNQTPFEQYEPAFAAPTAEVEQQDNELVATMTQLDHMATYGGAVLSVAAARAKEHLPQVQAPRLSTERAVAAGASLVLLASTAVGTATAKVRARGEGPATPAAEIAKKQTVPKPKVWVTTPFSDMDNSLQKKFFRETGKREPVACYPGNCKNSRYTSKYARVSSRKKPDGSFILSWRHKSSVYLYAVREELNDGRIRFTKNFKEKFKNGSFIENKMLVSESGRPVSREGATSGVVLYFKNKVKKSSKK